MKHSVNISTTRSFTFVHYVWKETSNRNFLLWGFGISILQFIIFKLLYPFPDFFSDSYSYLFAAYAHLDVNIWPIGYSKFLSIFHQLTWSDTALIATQYFLMQFAALYFFFTILYLFDISKNTQKILFIFFFINPLTLYLCNTVNSDALFGSISLIWFTQLVWIIQRPRIYQVFVQAILLFLCFTVRNNAYYYPVIAIIAFFLSGQSLKVKLLGTILPFLLIVPFIIHTRNEAYKLTGVRQFSFFTGWQLANNALYIYDQIEIDTMTLPTPEARRFNQTTIPFFKHIRPEVYRNYLETFEGNFFLRDAQSPMKEYFKNNYTFRTEMDIVRNWGKASAAFEAFGKVIILHHPFAYIRYFIWPNIGHYFMPPLLHLELYNYGANDIDPIAKHWFHYRTNRIHCISHSLQGFLIIYKAFFLLFNVFFLWQIVQYVKKIRPLFIRGNSFFWLSTAFLFCNFWFSVFATVNIIRYQYIPMFILLTFGLLIEAFLKKLDRSKEISAPVSQNNQLSYEHK